MHAKKHDILQNANLQMFVTYLDAKSTDDKKPIAKEKKAGHKSNDKRNLKVHNIISYLLYLTPHLQFESKA